VDRLYANNIGHILNLSRFSAPVSCWFILSGICLGGRSPAAACVSGAELLSAITFGAVALQNSTARHHHDEETMEYWALSAMVCRVTEWLLWAKKCWVGGTRLAANTRPATDPQRGINLTLFLILGAQEAAFNPSFPMLAAAVMEYYTARARLENPFWTSQAGFHGFASVSTSQYLEYFWGMVVDRTAVILGIPNTPEHDLVELNISFSDFVGCSWLLELSHLELRATVPRVRLKQNRDWKKNQYGAFYPRMPGVDSQHFMEKFCRSPVGEHVYLGMAVVTSHWVKKPLAEFLEFVDTSGLPNRGLLT
jgi:hypothetical protein